MTNPVSFIDLHYRFSDASHSMDAFIQNRCELDFLKLLKTIGYTCDSKIIIESEPKLEGGLINRYKIKEQNKRRSDDKENSISTPIKVALLSAVFIAPTTIVVNSINEIVKQVITGKMQDPVIENLEEERLRLEIEKIKADIEQKKQERIHDSLENRILEVEILRATEDFRWHLIKLNGKYSANNLRLKFYQKLAHDARITSISTQVLNQTYNPIVPEFTVEQSEFAGLSVEGAKELKKIETSLSHQAFFTAKAKNEIMKKLNSGKQQIDGHE